MSELRAVVFESTVVTPVAEEIGVKGNVKVVRVGTMECDWAGETIGVLERIMAVIPRCAVLCNAELVREVIFGGNGALCDSVDSIVLEAVEHADTVPVNGSSIIPEVVLDCYLHCVTPAGFNPRSWVLFVEDLAAIGT